MTEAQLRVVLRWVHIILGLVVMCYIYSPFSENQLFQLIVKWGVVPIITFSGIWIWKFKVFNKKLGIKS